MGALIQTKGTQRLAKLFNDRFDDSIEGISKARKAVSTVYTLLDAFATGSDLQSISDNFIAQNAVAGSWPADLNDFLYPSATMRTTNPSGGPSTDTLNFKFPAGFSAFPPKCLIAVGSAVCGLEFKSIPKGTLVGAVNLLGAGNFSVELKDKAGAPVKVSVNINPNTNEMISFAKKGHPRLVRRWRWYLQHDLKSENNLAIKTAICNALDDLTFTKIVFQTVEDVQKVLVTPLSKLNPNDELDDEMHMHILLLTQSTTAPDKLDPQ